MKDKMNTFTRHNDLVMDLAKSGDEIAESMTGMQAHLLHMAVGISGEAGEIIDTVKKHVIYNKELDVENLIEELGDLMFYINGIRMELGISYEVILEHNIKKLRKRYPDSKFSDLHAQIRADKK